MSESRGIRRLTLSGRRKVAAVALTLAVGIGVAFAGDAAARSQAASHTFVYVVPAVPTHLGLWPSEGNATSLLYQLLDSKLVDYNLSALANNGCSELPTDTDLIGNLASSWIVKPNKYVQFTLRDVKSAYGNELNAEDVRWSLDRSLHQTSTVLNSALGTTAQFNVTDGNSFNIDNFVKIINPHTVRLILKKSTVFDVISWTNDLTNIWDATEAMKYATPSDPQANAWFQNNTADFGPWKVSSFTPGVEIDLVPNPYWKPYYKGTRGNITKVVIQAVPDATVRDQLLQTGAAQYASALSSQQYLALEKTSGVTVKTCVSASRDFLMLNEHNPVFANVQVRQAISDAIDRKALVNVAYSGVLGRPARFGLSQFVKFPQPPASEQFTYNVAKAKSLLAAAGYPNGFTVNLTYSESRPGPQATPDAILIQTMLAAVGITVNLQNVASSTNFTTINNTGDYDMEMYSENAVLSDPIFNSSAFTQSDSPNDAYGFDSPTWDAALNNAKFSTPGTPQYFAALKALAIQGPIQVPIVYLVDDISILAFRSNVTGFHYDMTGWLMPQYLSMT